MFQRFSVLLAFQITFSYITRFGNKPVVPICRHRIDLSDLISAGYIEPGCLLIPKGNKYAEHVATLLPDGRLDIGGTIYATPSHASRTIRGRRSNGWYFFMVDKTTKNCSKIFDLNISIQFRRMTSTTMTDIRWFTAFMQHSEDDVYQDAGVT